MTGLLIIMKYQQPADITVSVTQILDWVQLHQWAPIIALATGFVVRLVKDDTKLPAALPAVWRPWFALLISMLFAACASIVGGAAWQGVLENGAVAFILAILGHQTLIEGFRGGEELPIPWLTRSAVIPKPPPLPAFTTADGCGATGATGPGG